MQGTWGCNSDHSMVPTLKEFIGNPLDTHDNQMRKLRSENKVTSEVTQPVTEPGLGTRSPTSFWSRTVITVQHHVTKMVCRLHGPARGR